MEAYGGETWSELLPRTRLAADTPHCFPLPVPVRASQVRINIYPDGGIARLRLHGSLTPAGLADLPRRFAL